ncbi:unnamed protein product, partial [Iphiclides podalirius]
MSSASVSSSKPEKVTELMQEVKSVRAMNASLRAYLEHLRMFKKNLVAVNENCKELRKVNLEWNEILSSMK